MPGLFGSSSVTESQIEASHHIFAEFRRRLSTPVSDEVSNKDAPDYADVDIYDAAKRAGIDGSLPKRQF